MKIQFLKRCFSIIQNSDNPNVKTHAFGMTSLDVLERFPLTSADSTSWIMCAANGGIYTPYGVISISNKSNGAGHYSTLSNIERKKIDEYIASLGFTAKDAGEDYKVRMKLNILYLIDWMNNYTYKSFRAVNGLLNI